MAVQIEQVRAEDLPLQMGRYRLLSVLGEGGMARVFRAELLGPAGFRKPVALKMLKRDLSAGMAQWSLQGLAQEARLGGLLKHPNIVDIYELGEHKGRPFISMELVHGLSLRGILRGGSEVPVSVFLDLAQGATAGLAQAHALKTGGRTAGLVHRDLKPSNFLVSWNGEVKLTDFGIAVTLASALAQEDRGDQGVAGTPNYMSPEQLGGRPLDGRSDLFSLGLVLFEVATRRRLLKSGELLTRLPIAMKREQSILLASESEELDGYLVGLGGLIERCLQPLPPHRYPSAVSLGEALQALRDLVGHRPGLVEWIQKAFPDLSAGLSAADKDPCATQLDDGHPTSITALSPLRPRSNLGPALDLFIGRTAELAALGKMVEQGARLITLKGTGGAGKTRLARHFARRSLDIFAGGAWFIDLTEAHSAMAIIRSLSQVLEIPLSQDWDLEGLILRVGYALRARGPVLILLDNFEQIVEHAMQTVGCWREMAPETVIMVTTRQRLRLGGEQVLDLAPLPESDGVELFEMRAAALGARWEDTPDNNLAVWEIVRELDGIPLAIELAASRAVHLPPVALQARMLQRFQLLGGARSDHGLRQASLWGLIDWSWSLLDGWERSALAQLSVFRDGFFLESAESVLDLSQFPEAPWILDVISALLDKSLLHSREVLGQPRFSMYLSVRDFAEHQLEGIDPSGLTRPRHAAHFAQMGTEEAILSLHRHGGIGRRRHLVVELDNCQMAVQSTRSAQCAGQAVACAMATVHVLLHRGPFAAGVEVIDRVLENPGVEDRDRFRLLQAKGELRLYVVQFDEAQGCFEEALELARSLGDPALEGSVLNFLGGLCHRRGRMPESKDFLNQALKIGVEHGVRAIERRTRRNLAVLHREKGGGSDAPQVLEDTLRDARERGDQSEEALSLSNLAMVQLERGELESAEANYRLALRLHGELGDCRLVAITQGNLANLVKQAGRTAEALQLYQQALQGIEQIGDRRASVNVLASLGNLHRQQGQLQEAEVYLMESIRIARELEHIYLEGLGMGNLGDVLLAQGRLVEARPLLEEAIEICQIEYPMPAGAFMGSLALIESQEGHMDRARTLLVEGSARLREGNKEELAKLLCKRGLVEQGAGDEVLAWEALAEAMTMGKEIRAGQGSDLDALVKRLQRALARD